MKRSCPTQPHSNESQIDEQFRHCRLPQTATRRIANLLYGFLSPAAQLGRIGVGTLRICRLADDAVDVEGGSLAAIAELRGLLDLAYSGRPLSRPIDRAFAETISRYGIPRELPEGLITGLEWDAVSRRYDTLEDLEAYAVRVAGTVGAMMALLMGTTSPELIARACDLGVAMQLTNIARDVGEDARMGRLYL